MIEEILPEESIAVEATTDLSDAKLWPEEEPLVAGAVEKRRLEFTTARHCARQALQRLGEPAVALLSGPKREPLWPAGIVGSITHCAGYRAAVVARERDLASVGVDAEPNEPLPDGVLESIALPGEAARVGALLRARPEVRWDRLLFCAKEAVYKTWFPLTHRWLDFHEADITFGTGTFTATLLVPGPRFEGRWLARSGLLLTAIAHR
ncbi:4'-phosphopantetheinyl transferase superfamily protein [Dactylosporangium sp. NPDC000244]|uniref:4'-phosphopantetheinyl transferase family protein n=1 Tax=Dactylosporangium sp. NPDC000244 TaxID=3154365 RepID=UPI0033204FFE